MIQTNTMAHIVATLDCGIEVWTSPVPKTRTENAKTPAQLIHSGDITRSELRLVVQTVRRMSTRFRDRGKWVGKPIEDSGLPWRRQVKLMSVVVAVMNARGLKRWEHKRDYSNYKKRA